MMAVVGLVAFSTSSGTGHAAGTTSKDAFQPAVSNRNNCGSWKTVNSTTIASANSYLNGSTVLALSNSDIVTHVWAVGYYTDPTTGFAQTLIEHRHGTTWTVIPSPNPGLNNTLTAVIAITATDVWAVGYSYTTDPKVDGQTLIVHWDGTSWTAITSPNPGTANTLSSITQIPGTSEFWATGFSDQNTLTILWDGTNWNTIPSASPVGGTAATLTGVTAFTAKSAWAVGNYIDGNGQQETLTEQWNGIRWKVIASPNVASATGSALSATSRVYSSTHVWAVGYSYTIDPSTQVTTYQTLAEIWNGSSWSSVTSPNVGQGNNALRGMGRVPGNDAFFAVGSSVNPKTSLNQSLVETYCR